MNWVDAVIVVIVLLSAGVGFVRGFLREVVGLATWIVAFYLAFRFAVPISGWLESWIKMDSARLAVAFAIVFIIVIIIGAFVNALLGRLVNGSGFAGSDRVLGLGFGVLRGVALLIGLVLFAGATTLPQDAWWQNSMLLRHLETGAIKVRHYLPDNLARSITYPRRDITARDQTI